MDVHARALQPNLHGVKRLMTLLAVVAMLLGATSIALGHAVPVLISPAANSKVAVSPLELSIRFSEPVDLLSGADLEVVDATGADVTGGVATKRPTDKRTIQVALRPSLPDGTYTVRYQVVSADGHFIASYHVFGVGNAQLGPAVLEGARPKGPGDTSVWAVSARFLELVCLGGLIGMLAFRWLIWRPAVATLKDGSESRRLAIWGRDAHWTGFGLLAAAAMLAEGYLLATKSALILGTSVAGALGRPTDLARILGDTRFGSFAQLRAGLLFGVFAVAIWQFLAEVGSGDRPDRPVDTGRRVPTAIMAILTLTTFGAISAQGHAGTGRFQLLSIGVDVVHLVAVAVWMTGIALLLVVLWRAPRVSGQSGRRLAGETLSRFSRVALVAVGAALVTGTLRMVTELSDPADLWTSSYGRSILYKLALLIPIVALGLRHKRIVLALKRVSEPNRATIALVRRSALLELGLSLAIVVVASLLVAQVPPTQ
jgi:copper transport protein